MNVTHIPTTSHDSAAVLAEIEALLARSLFPSLPPDADRTPVLPHTGGVPGEWITASPHPTTARAGVTLYVHGGRFSRYNVPLGRLLAYRFSQATSRPALAVDYRLAPDHPYPAALNDVVAAYQSLLAQGIPAARIILAGESSGATLVLSALQALKQTGSALPAAAVAVSPLTDLTLSSPSIDANDGQDMLDRVTLEGICAQYLAGAHSDRAPQSPLHGDLRGLPPLLLAAGSKEVLLDDARRFAEAASAAGASVQLDIYDGMPHAFHVAALPATTLPPTALIRRIAEWIEHLPSAESGEIALPADGAHRPEQAPSTGQS
jgi:epsilon-lactone hydrolase